MGGLGASCRSGGLRVHAGGPVKGIEGDGGLKTAR